jgi:hypothetical protein
MHAQAAPVMGGAPTRNRKLLKWVEDVAALTQPIASIGAMDPTRNTTGCAPSS